MDEAESMFVFADGTEYKSYWPLFTKDRKEIAGYVYKFLKT